MTSNRPVEQQMKMRQTCKVRRSKWILRGKINGTFEGLFQARICSWSTRPWWYSGVLYLRIRKQSRQRYCVSLFTSYSHFCLCTFPFRNSEVRSSLFFAWWSCFLRTGMLYMSSIRKIGSRWKTISSSMQTSPPLWCSSGQMFPYTFAASRPIYSPGACASP